MEAGLDDETDNFQRGRIGISYLKGVGDLEPDRSQINVNNFLAAIPPEFRDRYVVTLESREIPETVEVEAQEDDGT